MVTIEKPPHGSPCNSCGLCCRMELCPIGARVFKRTQGPCPAIDEQPDGRSFCGLMTKPASYVLPLVAKHGVKAIADSAKFMNGSGTGCDAINYGEKPNEEYQAQQNLEVERRQKEVRKNLRIWSAFYG